MCCLDDFLIHQCPIIDYKLDNWFDVSVAAPVNADSDNIDGDVLRHNYYVEYN
jgi:hypothetical protein